MMESFEQTFTLAGTVGKYERVKFSGASVVVAGLTDRGIGVAMQGGVSGDEIRVRLDKAPSSFIKVAAAIAAGAQIFSAASGKGSTSASTAFRIGWAKEASTANNDVIEYIPDVSDVAVA